MSDRLEAALSRVLGSDRSDRPAPATVASIKEQIALLSNRPDFKVGDVIALDRLIPNVRWEVGMVAVVVETDPAKIPVVSLERGDNFTPNEWHPILVACPLDVKNGGYLLSTANPSYFRLATEEEIEEANQNPKPAF